MLSVAFNQINHVNWLLSELGTLVTERGYNLSRIDVFISQVVEEHMCGEVGI